MYLAQLTVFEQKNLSKLRQFTEFLLAKRSDECIFDHAFITFISYDHVSKGKIKIYTFNALIFELFI